MKKNIFVILTWGIWLAGMVAVTVMCGNRWSTVIYAAGSIAYAIWYKLLSESFIFTHKGGEKRNEQSDTGRQPGDSPGA